MAAFTSKAAGNWSASGTTTWTQAGVPGANDTVTISHAITVDTNTTIGLTAFTTGGTAAIALNTGATLGINAGVSLTCSGDIAHAANFTHITLSAGASVTLKPPSAQQCVWDFARGAATTSSLICNGSSGSHCAVATDKSLGGSSSYMNNGDNNDSGVLTATYTDFSNFGDSTHPGVVTKLDRNTTNTAGSLTHCTFTGCSYSGLFGPNHTWDGNYTFQNNSFSSSVAVTNNGLLGMFGLAFNNNRTSGTRLVDTCSFDGVLNHGAFRQCTFTNNLVLDKIAALSGTSWPSDSYWNNNLVSSAANTAFFIYGPIRDFYSVGTASDNPHYMGVDNSLTAGTITGGIFEATDAAGPGNGDCIFPPTIASGTPTLSVTKCIVLPGATSHTSGKLVSDLQTSKVAVTVEHNTYCGTSGEHALVGTDETASSYAGEIASCRANIVWSASSSTNVYAINATGSGTPAVDAVTTAGYNWFQNPNSGTCTHDTSTSQGSVVGYNGIKVSGTGAFPNAQIGTGDRTGDPQFFDATRDLASWGGTVAGGGVATVAGAIAAISANPALIGQATTGLLAWVRAGFQPQNAALSNASYAGDSSTTDAAGNSWPTGPGIGAMAAIIGNPAVDGPLYPSFFASPSRPVAAGWV